MKNFYIKKRKKVFKRKSSDTQPQLDLEIKKRN